MQFLDPDFSNLSSEQLDEIDRVCSRYESQRSAGASAGICGVRASAGAIHLCCECERIVRCSNRHLGVAFVGMFLGSNLRDQRDKLDGGGTQKCYVGSHRSGVPTTEGHWGRSVACLRRLTRALLAITPYRLSATNFAS